MYNYYIYVNVIMRGIVLLVLLVVLLLLAVAHYHYDYRRYFVFILNLIHYLIYINNIHTCIDHYFYLTFSHCYTIHLHVHGTILVYITHGL